MKLDYTISFDDVVVSLPTRERGLKHLMDDSKHIVKESLPTRERGLKQPKKTNHEPTTKSLPTRERGLKPPIGAWVD